MVNLLVETVELGSLRKADEKEDTDKGLSEHDFSNVTRMKWLPLPGPVKYGYFTTWKGGSLAREGAPERLCKES